MIGALITILVYVLVFGILYWLVDYLVNAIPIPDPFGRFARILVVVIFCLIIIVLLLNLIGASPGLNLPRFS